MNSLPRCNGLVFHRRNDAIDDRLNVRLDLRFLGRFDHQAGMGNLGLRFGLSAFASTGAKNPAYSDTLYVDNLIGPHTVNTVPLATLQAFLDHGVVARTVDAGVDQAKGQVARLAELGVDLEETTQKLQDEGVEAFSKSFQSLMETIAQKRQQLLKKQEVD